MVYQTRASYYRVALLLGVVSGDNVHEWATQAIERDASPPRSVIDLALIPTSDLTELRHALWTLAVEPEPPQVLRAVLGTIQADVASGRRTLADTVTMLRQMRSMVRLPVDFHEAIGEHVNAHMLATAGVRGSLIAVEATIVEWLQRFAQERLETVA